MRKKEFEEVSIPKWKLAFKEAADKVYRVFKSETEFEEVEASSANEAIQKAGLEDVFAVRMGKMDEISVYNQTHLEANAEVSQETEKPISEDQNLATA